MITFKEALTRAEKISEYGIYEEYGETPTKYVFAEKDSSGGVAPGGDNLTVDKETGECQYEYLEREFLAPYAPIRGYKKIEVEMPKD